MDLKTAFRTKIDRWGGPLGPFGSPEQNEAEMRAFGGQIQAATIDQLVDEAATWSDAESDRRFAAIEFFRVLADLGQRHALADALVRKVQADGPALIVELWGGAGSPEQVSDVFAKIDIGSASPRLAIALTDALWEVGGDDAVIALKTLRAGTREREVLEEIAKALAKLAPAIA